MRTPYRFVADSVSGLYERYESIHLDLKPFDPVLLASAYGGLVTMIHVAIDAANVVDTNHAYGVTFAISGINYVLGLAMPTLDGGTIRCHIDNNPGNQPCYIQTET